MGEFSITHILLVSVIVLIFFGPSRLPGLGQSLGKAIRGFKEGLEGEPTDSSKTKNSDALSDGATHPTANHPAASHQNANDAPQGSQLHSSSSSSPNAGPSGQIPFENPSSKADKAPSGAADGDHY